MTPRHTELPPRLIPELQALAASSTRLPQSSSKSVSSVSSPSTRFSSSPSPWSISTTTTTPTSWSSASPGIVQQVPMTGPAKRSQTVPLPAGRRERRPKVPALPEYIPPPIENEWRIGSKDYTKSLTRKKTPLQTPAPTPPPRTSSAKHSLSRSSSKSDRRQATSAQEPTPSSSELEHSPLARRGRLDLASVGESLQQNVLARAHDDLQQSLGRVPPRQTRKDAEGLPDKRTIVAEVNRLGRETRTTPTTPYEGRRGPQSSEPVQRQERHAPIQAPPETPWNSSSKTQSSPSRTGTFSRLGFFSRRAKSPTREVEKSPRKLQRKGPTAGTGHEGYGRYGKRGRKTSQESTSAAGSESERSVSSTRRIPLFSSKGKESRSSSRHNRSSQSDLDEFASTRLKPVPIIGGSGSSMKSNTENQLDIYGSSPPSGTVFDRWDTPSQSQTSLGQKSFQERPINVRDHVSGQTGAPTLAIRRSQRFGNDADSFNLPTPIRTEGLSAATYINSQDESRSSAFPASTPSTTTDPSRGDLGLQKTKEKKSRKLRWNIFRRRGTDPEPERPVALPSSSPEEMQVSVSAIPVARSMPYYAMMDSESEVNPPEHVGDYLAQVVESPQVSPLIGVSDHYFVLEDELPPQPYEDNEFLPNVPISPPQSFTKSPPPVPLHNTDELVPSQAAQSPPRQPRLVRVGRIPAVVPRNEREHKPSRTSFSQPFLRAPVFDDPSTAPNPSDAIMPLPLQISTDVLPSRPFISPDTAQPASAPNLGEAEFLRFPSRQTSNGSTSSSSGGVLSILGPSLVSSAPGGGFYGRSGRQLSGYLPGSPSIDEVWNEYDDFIDHVMSPSRARKSIKALSRRDEPETERFEPDT
ncbi:hypothetical protein H2200_008294 [Cladophialophora chaetospira]|uniref:Uncharacterized protein n=1 Tax=Cladophialophora chaetospira TaxID=386627 RepID=A0AA38X5K5_9EURO|nr:hypothetical protein H2200_008294 [Cladophialophora chaetospira]